MTSTAMRPSLVGFMRQQNAAGDVANGVNGRIVGLLLLVDFDEAFFVESDLGVFQAEVVGIGHAAHGDQHAVVKFFFLLAVDFELNFDLFAAGGHLADFGFQPDFFESFFRVIHHRPGEVGIGAGKNGIERFDEHDFAAERGVNGAQFHADVTAADDEQILGNVFDFQRFARSHDARIAEIKRFRHRGFGADGNDRLFEIDELLALLGFNAKRVRIFEITAAVHDLHAAHFGELRDAAGQFGQDGFFPRAQFGQIDGRLAESDAAMLGFPRGGNRVRRVQATLWKECNRDSGKRRRDVCPARP